MCSSDLASTKAFTTQLMVLASFAIAMARTKGAIDAKAEARLSTALTEVPSRAEEVLAADAQIAKIAEEVAEFRAAPDSEKASEFGDLLFAMANVARHLGIDPEAALRGTNAKFERRFAHVEARLAEMGKEPKQSSLEEMDRLWDEAKRLGK